MSGPIPIDKQKPIKADPVNTNTLTCVIPAGTPLLTGDWYTITVAHPVIIDLPEWCLASVD